MARALTPQDAYAIMNALVYQATGQQTITAVDANSFVSAGETVLSYGTENTLNALGIVLGRTLIAARPYTAKLKLINAIDTGQYTHRLRKISYFARVNQEAGDWNTNLNDNLLDGRDNMDHAASGSDKKSVGSMWEQNQPKVAELNFAGQDVWDTSTTIYEYQLKVAFRGPNEFNQFIAGIMTEKQNDIESTKEAFNRITMLNMIAGLYSYGTADGASGADVKRAVNLTAAFNSRFGTSYTSQELRTVHLDAFLKFMVPVLKLTSRRMSERSMNFNRQPANAPDGYKLLRHTPRDKQKLFLYDPLITEAEAYVFPEIFNDRYLRIENYEPVDYWQSNYTDEQRPQVKFAPALAADSQGYQATGTTQEIPYVVGLLFDEDALMTDYQMESADATPIEARKKYHNIWWHFSKNAINDFTENAVLFYMAD